MKLDFINGINSDDACNHFPQLEVLKDVMENNICHNNESVYAHTMQVFDNCKDVMKNLSKEKLIIFEEKFGENSKKDLLLLSSLFHDIGKKETIIVKDKQTSCPEHEKIGAEIFKKFFKDILSSEELEYCMYLIKEHASIHILLDNKSTFLNKYLSLEEKHKIDLAIIGFADIYKGDLLINNSNEYNTRIKLLSDVIGI